MEQLLEKYDDETIINMIHVYEKHIKNKEYKTQYYREKYQNDPVFKNKKILANKKYMRNKILSASNTQ